jgi:hypothetical protein
MAKLRAIAGTVIGLLLLIGAGTYLYKSYRVPAPQPEAATETGTLTIPTVDEMCQARGATDADALKQCRADENAAGEFVIAWMAYNNFIVDGQISLGQIQSLASLDDNGPLAGLGSDPSLAGDPSTSGFDLADPLIDPATGSSITAGVDPLTGLPNGFLQSPAQLALYCLQMATDWMAMHDCISENDPSSQIGGAP